jgi:hypothetical protein
VTKAFASKLTQSNTSYATLSLERAIHDKGCDGATLRFVLLLYYHRSAWKSMGLALQM